MTTLLGVHLSVHQGVHQVVHQGVHRSVHQGVHRVHQSVHQSVHSGVHQACFWGVHCSPRVNTLVNTSKLFERKELDPSVHQNRPSQEKSPHTPLYARAQKGPARGWVFTFSEGQVNSEHLRANGEQRCEQSPVSSLRSRVRRARPCCRWPRRVTGPSQVRCSETERGTLPLLAYLSFLPIAPNPRTTKVLRVGIQTRS